MTLSYFKALPSPPHILGLLISYIISGSVLPVQAQDFNFNIDVLDVNDRKNIDLGQFARSGYIMPGDYVMAIQINKQELSEQPVNFYVPENDPKGSEACITPKIVEQIGLKPDMVKKLNWWHEGQCVVMGSLPGMTSKGDLGAGKVYLNIPQAYLEYTDDNWDPPSRWDDGIPGLLLDYNLNTQAQHQQKGGGDSYNVSGNGTVGANMGAWRLRADWQGRVSHQSNSSGPTQKNFDWSRYYAYRAIRSLHAKLTVGENYLNSDIFDSFRFAGVSLTTDDNMLPPNLRGYAPEVTGIARTNAKVVISQQGRVLQEVQVAAGPFRIQDINDAVRGRLDIRVEELDGSVQEFKMETASVPYLSRPGTLRYKVASGRPTDWKHRTNGPIFGSGEFTYGVSNGWSLYGGGVSANRYNSLALGIGRDLLAFGAISFDATQSRARLRQEDKILSGGSYRLQYSKRFDDYDSQITFAGYRFSQKNYMSMSEYLDALVYGSRLQNSKQMYTIQINQNFSDIGLSIYLNYQHQTFWNRPDEDNYNISMSRYFDIGRFKNISVTLQGTRSKFNGSADNTVALSLMLPWGNTGTVSYNSNWDRRQNSQTASYSNQLNNRRDNYQLGLGEGRSGVTANGYYTHQGEIAQMSANASYQEGLYSGVGASLQGGATATLQGAALHRSGGIGGTRMLLDTGGVSGIPIGGYGVTTKTNYFGKAVVADVSNYYRNRISIDLNKMPENAEAQRTVVQATLTEGAIGYKHFEIVSGEKAMAVLRLADGSTPPFGATVLNSKQQNVGIVNDEGSVYLSGIKAGELMTVHWGGQAQCELTLPEKVTSFAESNLLLPCRLLNDSKKQH